MPDGAWPYDIEAKISRSPLFTSSPLTETVFMKGTLYVSTYNNLSPLLSDDAPTPLVAI
jgi:hypothetical protein